MDLRPFLIHYYLADDTIDITEVKTPNSGHDSFPKLLNKMKIQKNWKDVPCKFIAMIGLGKCCKSKLCTEANVRSVKLMGRVIGGGWRARKCSPNYAIIFNKYHTELTRSDEQYKLFKDHNFILTLRRQKCFILKT